MKFSCEKLQRYDTSVKIRELNAISMSTGWFGSTDHSNRLYFFNLQYGLKIIRVHTRITIIKLSFELLLYEKSNVKGLTGIGMGCFSEGFGTSSMPAAII